MASGDESEAGLTVTSEDYADCRVVAVSGRVDHTNSDRFLQELTDLTNSVAVGGGLVTDLSKLEFITSAGLRALLMADRHVKGNQGKMIVAGIEGVVKEVFRISKFDALLNVVDTAAEGVGQVSSAASEAYKG
ncbi:MAG: STAS domain-containing protein [Pseudomonadota bacterium]